MTNPSPHPNSFSPKDQPKSAFQWPAPLSPRSKQDTTNSTHMDMPLRDILDKYKDDPEILKHILIAKAEEDKRQASKDVLKTEQARVHLRQLDLEYLREQNKLPLKYTEKNQYPSSSLTGTTTGYQQQNHHQNQSSSYPLSLPPLSQSSSIQNSSYYSNLQPVQQQALARITGNSDHYSNDYAPSSPVSYPHSAHPLCPPSSSFDSRNKTSSSNNRFTSSKSTNHSTSASSSSLPFQRLQPPNLINSSTSTSASSSSSNSFISSSITNDNNNKNNLNNNNLNNNNLNNNINDDTNRYKRNRYSVSESNEDKIPHSKVMEALKAKIQRGSGSPVNTTPPMSLPYRAATTTSATNNNNESNLHIDKRQRQLPKLNVSTDINNNNNNNNGINNNNSGSSNGSHNNIISSSSNTSISTPTSTNPIHTPSPRSAKPILPPIDTSIGRHPPHSSSTQYQQNHLNHRSLSTSPPPRLENHQVSPSDQILAMDSKRQDRFSSKSSLSPTSSSDDSHHHHPSVEHVEKGKSSDSD